MTITVWRCTIVRCYFHIRSIVRLLRCKSNTRFRLPFINRMHNYFDVSYWILGTEYIWNSAFRPAICWIRPKVATFRIFFYVILPMYGRLVCTLKENGIFQIASSWISSYQKIREIPKRFFKTLINFQDSKSYLCNSGSKTTPTGSVALKFSLFQFFIRCYISNRFDVLFHTCVCVTSEKKVGNCI